METTERYPETRIIDTQELLSTKLTPPRLRASIIARPSLLYRLDAGLDQRLTLVSAPAGSGKTTVVAQWIAHLPFAAGWVSLDEGDNDPARFWYYLIACIHRLHPAVGIAALETMRGPRQYRLDVAVRSFVNDLTRLTDRCVLVLEDYHQITSPLIHDTMARFLEFLPPTLHVVLIGRVDPPLPLARLRAHGDINELRATDLQFTADETRAFLETSLPFDLESDQIAELKRRTEGWAVGLQVAALSLRKRETPDDIEAFLAAFTGGHHTILDYLVLEVLDTQPDEVQDFLLQTAFLDVLCSSLCNAVTLRDDSSELLKAIESANLFLVPLDETHTNYRYHALFAEAMQHHAAQRLSEQSLRELRNRASLWYEGQGRVPEAIEMALAAGTLERAAELIEQTLHPRQMNNAYYTLRRWADQLPDELLTRHPILSFQYAISILFTSDRHATETPALVNRPLEIAEQVWKEGNQAKLGEVLALRALMAYWQGNPDVSFAIARQALALLPDEALEWRGITLLHIATGEWSAGNAEAARSLAHDARALTESVGNEYARRATDVLLGEIALGQGKLVEARQRFQQLLEEANDDQRDRAHALVGLGTVAFEQNDLEMAQAFVTEAHRLAESLGDKHILVDASILHARWLHAQGKNAEADQNLETMAIRVGIPELVRALRAWQAWIALARGDIVMAQGWRASIANSQVSATVLLRERETLVAARVLVVQGKTDAALDMLGEWQRNAQTGNRARAELEILILTALAHYVEKRLQQAKATLIAALDLAQQAGYVRLFLQEGAPIEALLREIYLSASPAISDYAHGLLRAFENEQVRNEAATYLAAMPVKDRLSRQEQRVLRLLGDGLSTPEIADELGVSVNTIKTQVKSIYSKLDISSRKEARRVAGQLTLL